MRTARSTTSWVCMGVVTAFTYSATSPKSRSMFSSCWKSLPMATLACWPTIATTGWLSQHASYRPFIRWTAPGPDVAMHTPTWPVNLAWAQAMSEAISSWVGRRYRKSLPSPSTRPSAPSKPPMPSPGKP